MLLLRVLAAILLLASCAEAQRTTPARAPAEACGAGYQVRRYDARLDISPPEKSLSGDVTIDLESCTDALAAVELEAKDMVVAAVTEGERALHFAQDSGALHVRLPAPARRGERRVLRVRYTGRPTRGMSFGPDFVYTAFHTGHWLVSNPDPADKATLVLQVTLPAGFGAVSGGEEVSRTTLPDGRMRFTWRETRPFSSFLFGFAAGRLTELQERAGATRLRYAGQGFTPAQLDTVFAATEPALRFFEEVAGVPYPGGRYAQALLPGAPAQELAGMSLMDTAYGRSVLKDPREDYLVVHELAHAWWGNLLTATEWSHFWLNEGITTFMVAAYKERRWGRDEYEREVQTARQRYERALAQGSTRPLVFTGLRSTAEAGGPITYSGGALVLHLLRRQVGEKAFWDGIRAYTRAGAAAGLVSTDDLRRAMERASGDDLRWFFDRWAFGPPPATLVARHTVEPGAVTLVLEHPDPGRLAVDVAVETDRGRTTRTMVLTRPREELRIPVEGTVVSVRVDPRGFLPRRPIHERPVPMLLHQLARDPEPAGRIDALTALVRQCPATGASDPACPGARAAAQRAATTDPARIVRQLAERNVQALAP